jgi:DNA-binding NarL/FixJ family response regulator
MNKFRILVADNHPVVRLGLCSLLASHEDWAVCGETGDGPNTVVQCRELKPDLLIVDICMPQLNGVGVARRVLKENRAQKILVFTNVDSEQVVRECLEAGVRGWVFKSEGTDHLISAVEGLRRNKYVFSPQISVLIMDGYLQKQQIFSTETKVRSRLTPREREVVQLVAEGQTTKEVAVTLCMSAKTVETHRSHIMSKLDLHSVAELVLYAVKNQIVHVQLPSLMFHADGRDGADLEQGSLG